MQIAEFQLERYFARWEFAARYNLCASDAEPVPLRELLALADPELLEWWHTLSLGYTETQGHPLLRAEIARQYERLTADDILTFSGGQEAIFLVLHALLQPGDHAVVVTPAYQSLHEIPRSIGATVTEVRLAPEHDWQLDLDRVNAALTAATRVLVINYPHNPTGALLEQETFLELCQLCDARGIHLLSDEVYRCLEYDSSKRLPCAADCAERAISLGVMSKSYGLAGLRLGWIATRDEALRQRVARVRDYTTICSSAPSEVLSTIALRQSAVLQRRALEIIQHNHALWSDLIERQADVLQWTPPAAGSVGFPRLRQGDADAFASRLVQQTGVLLLPGSKFGDYPAHFRVGLGRRGIEPALRLVEEHLGSARTRTTSSV